jgi:hypothetical protein
MFDNKATSCWECPSKFLLVSSKFQANLKNMSLSSSAAANDDDSSEKREGKKKNHAYGLSYEKISLWPETRDQFTHI